jgi:hypothetical protein
LSYGSTGAQSYLAGSYTGWLVTEIEVYEMTQPTATDSS